MITLMLMIIISGWYLTEWLSSVIIIIIGCHYILIHFFLTSFWCKQKNPVNLPEAQSKTLSVASEVSVFDKYELHLKTQTSKSQNMKIFLFYRNYFPAQQQLFGKSRSFELLPFRRPNPGASSESQAVGEHLLHEVILQTHSWYVFG